MLSEAKTLLSKNYYITGYNLSYYEVGISLITIWKSLIDIIFIINLNQMDIALLLVVNCKFDIIIDRTLWTLCNYMT